MIVGIAWLAVARPWKEPPPVGAEHLAATLELAAGEVLLDVEGSDKPMRLLSRTPLPEAASISTGAGARALIRLGDGSRVFMHEQSALRLDGGILLERGKVWLDAPPLEQGQEPTVHRLGGTSVTLADGGASFDLSGDAAAIYVAEGLAIVTSSGGRSEVEAGEQAKVEGDAAPTVEPVAFWNDWTGGMGDRGSLSGSDGVGSGRLYAVDRQAPPGSRALPLSIQRQTVKVAVKDDVAETVVDQHFFNPSSRPVEGFYWFTIPEGSQLVSFALETDGRLVEGEIVERHEAAAKYEAAVQRANDPALLEWIDDQTVRARIFPVSPLGTRRVVTRYQQLLVESEGRLRYTYPLAAPAGAEAATIEEFALQVELGDLAESYEIATLGEARVEDDGRRVTMRRSGYTPRADFELELQRKPGETIDPLRLNLIDPGGDQARFIMVRYVPDVDFDAVEVPSGDIVVVVDTSAAGDPAEHQTKLAVAEALLRSLSEGDRFAIMSADVTATVLYPEEGLAAAEPDAISRGLEVLAQHSKGGATDLGAIFETALERVHGAEQPAIVYVGDGMATSGERGGDALAERLRRSMTGSRARLFTVGVGQEVDDRMLAQLARVGGGESTRVQIPEEAVVRALALSGSLKTPTITDLEIDLGEGLDDVFINATGKLSRGQQLVLLARTHHDLPDEVTIRGRLAGEDFERTHDLERDASLLDQLVPRLWAGAFIERLLGDSRGPEAVRGKILSLGLQYGLMSPYTSVLALESEQAYAQMGIQRRQRPLGGVRLIADAGALIGGRSSARDGVLTGLAGAMAAPFGCGSAARDEAPAATMKEAAGQASQSTPAREMAANRAEAPASEPAPAATPGDMAEQDAEPSVARGASALPAAPPAEPVESGAADDRSRRAADKAAPLAGLEGLVEEERAAEPMAGEDDGDGSLGGLYGAGARPEEVEKSERKAKRRPRRPLAVVSPVTRDRALPCSDVSSRSLRYRQILWSKRLARLSTMVDALDSYEAAAGSCEIKGWKDQRAFLQLLQQRAATEHDILMLLAHFRGEPDAQQYLARALLRRLLDPGLVAAVQNALFGDLVDWYDVDRRVALELDPDDQIKIVRDALARTPGDPEGERRLIALLVKHGKIEDAVARGRRLREQGLMTPGLAQQLGEVLVTDGRNEDAQRLFSEIVEFDPRSAVSRRLLGDIFLRHGWYAGAYRQYRSLVELAPEDVGASIRIARAAAGAGRVDEGLRVLRKVAAGEGRPGVDDPRRWARLHAAAYLGGLLESPSQEVSKESISRELKRLQIFDAPATWTLLVWEDLEARLVLAPAEPDLPPIGDAVDAGNTGLHALQLPPSAASGLLVRHSGPVLDRPVAYTIVTLRWDGSEFSVERSGGKIPAGKATEDTVASADPKGDTDQAG